MPKIWSKKDERQYKAIVKSCLKKDARKTKSCKSMAAAIVNKRRGVEGRTKRPLWDKSGRIILKPRVGSVFGVHVSYKTKKGQPFNFRDAEARKLVCKTLKKRKCPYPDRGFWFQQQVRDLEFDNIPGYRMTRDQALKVARVLRSKGFRAKVTRA